MRLLFASALFTASITPSWALAQSADPWTEPLNLSHSGVATNPAIVTDSEGVVHVVWQDNLANFVYTRFDGEQWTAPEPTDLNVLFDLPPPEEAAGQPGLANYTGPNPLFLAGPDQDILSFWISPQGRLFRSKVRSSSFDDVGAWDSGRTISREATSFAVAVSPGGELHLAYFRTVPDAANPAGVYYTRSKNSGVTWSTAVLLYESTYFSGLSQGEANLSIATSGTQDALRVYLAWDNRPRRQVFLAQSADGGETWGEPAVVAGPVPDSGPLNIQVGATQDSVVLVWQSGRATDGLLSACSQIYQSSSDGGATWSDPQPMIEESLGCAQSMQFVPGLANSPETPLYFLSETKSRVFLSVWNGRQWSQPESEPILSGFEEPEIFTEVIYACHRASLSTERLYVVGCDQGEGGDIWATSRDLGSAASLLEPPLWSQLSPVTSDSLEMETVDLVATNDDLMHAFFSQQQDPAIYYTYWDGEVWSRVAPVFELPGGAAGSPAIATGPGNELFLIAPDSTGALYFSLATSGNAATASRWSPPAQLETSHNGEIGSVDVAWNAAGTIYVAYSVPVNEQRGIYLVQSSDQGTTWSAPLQVFNGAAAEFDLVGTPSLLTSEDGFLHMVWKQQSIQGDGVPQPIALYYTRSEDGGYTFNAAEPVVEEPVAWQEIVADGEGNLHLLWQPQNTLTTVWDQVSSDGGNSWQFPQGLPDEGTTTAITVDSDGRLHFIDAGADSLGHWLWDGSRWQPEESLEWNLAVQEDSPVDLLAAAVDKQGKMVIVLEAPLSADDAAASTLFYSSRMLKGQPNQTAVKDSPTPTLVSPTLAPVTPTLEPSSTATGTVDSEPTSAPGETSPNETSGGIPPLTMALVPVALLMLVVLGFVIRRAIRAEDR